MITRLASRRTFDQYIDIAIDVLLSMDKGAEQAKAFHAESADVGLIISK